MKETVRFMRDKKDVNYTLNSKMMHVYLVSRVKVIAT